MKFVYGLVLLLSFFCLARPGFAKPLSLAFPPVPAKVALRMHVHKAQGVLPPAVSARPPARGCAAQPPEIPVAPKFLTRVVNPSGFLSLLPLSMAACLTPSSSASLVLETRDENLGLSNFVGHRFAVTVKSIKKASFAQILQSNSSLSESLNGQRKLLKSSDTEFALVEFSPTESQFTSGASLAVPEHHPYAANVKTSDLERLRRAGAVILDVRAKSQFKQGSAAFAVSLPIGWKPNLRRTIASLFTVASVSKLWTKPVNFYLGKPVILVGTGVFDFGAYNDLTLFHRLGHQKLYWCRGGFDELRGVAGVTPETAPGQTQIITASVAVQMLKEAQFIDVRSKAEYQASHVKDANQIEFVQRLDSLGAPMLRRLALSVVYLKSAGETFQLGAHQLQKTVIYAADSYDWRSYKASLWVSDPNVFWLRGGLHDFWDQAELNGQASSVVVGR